MNRNSSALLLVVLALFSFALTSCVGKSKYDAQIEELMAFKDSVEQAQKAQNSNSAANNSESSQTGYNETSSNETSSSSSQNNGNYVGTWEFTDNADNVWEVILNSDETCTMGIKGNEGVAYGSWEKLNFMNYTPDLTFPDEKPVVCFPDYEMKGIYSPHIIDGYIYKDWQAAKAKNPKKRLPIKKVR